MKDSCGLSTQYYPCITQRRRRGQLARYTDPKDIFEWDGHIICVDNSTLYYDDTALCPVTTDKKQFAVVNTNLVVWPDKIIVDLTNNHVTNMEDSIAKTGTSQDQVKTESGKILKIDPSQMRHDISGQTTAGLRWYRGCGAAPVFSGGQWSAPSGYSIDTISVIGGFCGTAQGSTALGDHLYFIPYKTELGEYVCEFARYWGVNEWPGSTPPPDSYFTQQWNTDGVYGVVTGIVSNDVYYYVVDMHTRGAGGSVTYKYDLYGQSGQYLLSGHFSVGDCVSITGLNNNVSVNSVKIVSIDDANGRLTFPDNTFATNETQTGTVTVKRDIPPLDYICESNNRLWGVSNSQTNRIYDPSTQTYKEYTSRCIYASALGKPMNFYDYEGVDTDSYAVAVGSEGNFTGIINYNGVCCWKENKLHRMFGDYPSEYYLTEYDIPGVQNGSARSMKVINEVLYYNGVFGVYQFNGNTPTLISYKLGRDRLTNANGGTDGIRYYISAKRNGEGVLYTYDTMHGLWLKDSDDYAEAFTTIGGDLYLVMNDQVLKYDDNVNEIIPWMAEFAPFTEQNFNRRRYIRLLLRLDMESGSSIAVSVKYDRGDWTQVFSRNTETAVTFQIPIPNNRCDRFYVKLEGTGEVTIRSMAREYTGGSIHD